MELEGSCWLGMGRVGTTGSLCSTGTPRIPGPIQEGRGLEEALIEVGQDT